MAIIDSYSDLVQNIKDTAEDDGTEFANFIPTAIDLAEKRLYKEMDLPDLESSKTTGTLTAASTALPKPSGHKYTHHLVITSDSSKKALKRRMETYLDDYWPDQSETGEPKYYTEDSETSFKIVPTPDINYPYEVRYNKEPDRLSLTNETNYYTDNCNEILYYATMVEMAKFMKAWSQVERWERDYTISRDGWNYNAKRKRRDDGEVPMNPDGGPNNLNHTIDSNS